MNLWDNYTSCYTYSPQNLFIKCKTRITCEDDTGLCIDTHNKLILFEELAFGHWGGFGDAAVVAFAAAAFAGKHGLSAFFVLLELHVFLDGERVCHGLNIEVVGTNEREGPVLLLQLLNHRANHLQSPLL